MVLESLIGRGLEQVPTDQNEIERLQAHLQSWLDEHPFA
jgi:hypothetical protein